MRLIDLIPEHIKKETKTLFEQCSKNTPTCVTVHQNYMEIVEDFLDLLELKHRFYSHNFDEEESADSFKVLKEINYVMNCIHLEFARKYPQKFLDYIAWNFEFEEEPSVPCKIHPYGDEQYGENHVEFLCGNNKSIDFTMREGDVYKIISAVLDAEDHGDITHLENRDVTIVPTDVYRNESCCIISPDSKFQITYKDKEGRNIGDDTPDNIWKVMQVCYMGENEGIIEEHGDAVIMSKNIYKRMADVFDFFHKVATEDCIYPLELDGTKFLVTTTNWIEKENKLKDDLLDKFVTIYRQLLDLNEEVDQYMKGDSPK